MRSLEASSLESPRGREYVIGLLVSFPTLPPAVAGQLHPEDRALLATIRPAEIEDAQRVVEAQFEEIYPAGV